jgi:hypothetical protein
MNGLRFTPLINCVETSWASLTVVIGGVVVTGITGIDYEDDQVIENVYGAGQQPVARGYGNIQCKGAITLLRSEVENIRTASATGRLQDIAPFDIVCSFVPVQGGQIITHKLRNCQFKKDSTTLKQGDTKNEQVMDLEISHIEWN